MGFRILLIDPDTEAHAAVQAAARMADAEVSWFASVPQALEGLERTAADLVLLAESLPDGNGLHAIGDLVARTQGAPVLVLGDPGEPQAIVDAVKRGAHTFLAKPLDVALVWTHLSRFVSLATLKDEVRDLRRDPQPTPAAFDDLLTRSPLMLGLFQGLERLAPSPLPLLIVGESGTGKELVARAVHRLSGRSGPLVPVNLAGLDDHSFSDTLFGHVRGAFTGAESQRPGLVRTAATGTLFLDEVGDLGSEGQVKLLRFVNDGRYYPSGSDREESSTARLVMATNADLRAKVAQGSFRADLYYRLMAQVVEVPPLRERAEDVPLLVEHFARKSAEALGVRAPLRTDAFVAALEGYRFPGNVRELAALVHTAVIDLRGPALGAHSPSVRACLARQVETDQTPPLETLDEATDRLFREALRRTDGNQSKAAQLVGVSQSTLSRWLGRGSAR